MHEQRPPIGPAHRPRSSAVVWFRILGAVVLSLSVAGGTLLYIFGPAEMKAADWAVLFLSLAAGLACGGLLLGLSALLRVLRGIHDAALRLEDLSYDSRESSRPTGGGERSSISQPAGTVDGDADDTLFSSTTPWREVVALLEDIRDNSLLSDQQREEKRLHVAEEEIHNATLKVRDLTAHGEYAQARQLVAAIVRRFPNEPGARELSEQVEDARERHESEDVRSCTQQVNDLITISAWDRAQELADQLRQRHPDSVEARQLLLRIGRERRLFEEEQRRRMNAEVQRFVTRRRWEEALAAARTFIERFPDCEESAALRMELPTLEANTEIEVRQYLEAKIMDCARHGRYIEAVDLARKVIADYPESPQAEALRNQLDRLEELAENPDAPPARIRIE